MSAERRPTPIPRIAGPGPFPLSSAQRGAWVRERIDPGQLFYNVFRVLELAGPLVPARLARALAGWVARHDVLNTTFHEAPGGPYARVGARAVALPEVDFGGLAEADRERELARRLREALRQPFDLESGPLFRFLLFRGSPERHWLLLSFHHIVIDGFSLRPMVREIEALYRGCPLPPPRLQYQDYTAWQEARLAAGELDGSRHYWEDRLAGEPPVLDLPRDRPRPAAPDHAGATVVGWLDARLRDRLKALRASQGTTLFRALLAALAMLLHRLTGERDLVVGSPLAGRTHPDLADLIGFFVTTPGLRFDLARDPSFAEMLAQAEATVAGAIRHQDYPWEVVLERLGVARDGSRPAVYSTVFTQRPVVPPQPFADLELAHWEYFLDVASFELTVAERETADGIQVAFNYARQLFDRATVERWMKCYRQLLESAVADPEAPVSALAIRPPGEREEVLSTSRPFRAGVDGEIDRRVRIRGFQVDPGEVEAALAALPGVGRAAVVAQAEAGGHRLVAYLTGTGDLDAVRAALEASLPRSMVPAQLVALDELPLDAHDRVDPGRLPPPPPLREGGSDAPRDGLERRMAEIWRDVLGVERVGIDDEFFDLGGHSLKAIQLTSRLRQELGLELKVADLFATATVARLAAVARRAGTSAGTVTEPPLARLPDAPSYRLSPAQEAQWFAAEILGGAAHKLPEILELAGALDRDALRAAVAALVARHAELRTSFAEEGGEPRQIIHAVVDLRPPLPEIDLGALAPATASRALDRVIAGTGRPFDLAAPPLLRACLVCLADRLLLLVNVPHIVSDGWSEQILFQDLAKLYSALRAGRNLPSPPVLRYVDFAAWQRSRLSSPALLAERAGWVARFRDTPPPPDLPAGPPEGEAGPATAVLDAARARPLLELAARHGATPFALFVALLAVVLARWTGRREVVVGSALAGRNRSEAETIVGVFINPVALRADLAGDPGFVEILGRIRNTVLDAVAQQEVPFQLWLEDLRRERKDGGFRPYSVVAMVHEPPTLEPFAGLAVRYLRAPDLLGPRAFARALAGFGEGGADLRLDVLLDDAVTLVASSATGRLRRPALDRLVRQLDRLAGAVVHDPSRPWTVTPLLDAGERATVASWSRGAARPAPDPLLLAAVEAWAGAAHPEALVVVDGRGAARADADPRLLDPWELRRHLLRLEAVALAAADGAARSVAAALAALPVDDRPQRVAIGGHALGGAPPDALFHSLAAGAAGLWARPGETSVPGVAFAGFPVAAHPVAVVDRAGEPVPAGVVGDLACDGARITGWRGRWRDDGLLEAIEGPPDLALSPTQGLARSRPAPPVPYRAPRTAIERLVVAAWRRALRRDRCGLDDTFSALGGTHAAAAALALDLAREGLVVAPGQLAAHPTPAELAAAIARAMSLAEPPPGGAPPTALQEALLAVAADDPRALVCTASFHGARGLDRDRLASLLDALVRRHDALRTRFEREGRLWLQYVEPAFDEVPLAIVARGEQEAFAPRAEALANDLDPIAGPPWKILAGEDRDGRVRHLAVAASRLAVDGRSWDLLAAAFAASGEAEVPGGPAPLSFQAWLHAAEREPAAELPSARAESWRFSAPWLPAERRALPSGGSFERLADGLARLLPATVETAIDRRAGGSPWLPDLSTTIGQFGALRPATAAPTGDRPAALRIRLDRRQRLHPTYPGPASLFLDGPPGPARLLSRRGEEPDAYVELLEGDPSELAVAVRPGTGWTAARLASHLAAHLAAAPADTPEAPAPPSARLPETLHVELDETDLEGLLG